MKRTTAIPAFILMGALMLLTLAGIRLPGIPSQTGFSNVEASSRALQTLPEQSATNQQAISDALALHDIDKWHEAGFTGAGVKVGIIDFGFQDLPSHPLSDDIDGHFCFKARTLLGTPIQEHEHVHDDIALCQEQGSIFTPPGHGTLNVEALHLFAPDAEVYITNPTEPFQVAEAIDWLIEQDVDVIIRSLGWSWEGAGDGKAFDGLSEHPFYKNRVVDIYSQLAKASDAGIVWSQGMVTAAHITWAGAFNDPDDDGWHNFSGSDECNDVGLEGLPRVFYPWLKWDDEVGNASAIRDLNFYLLAKGDSDDLKDLTQMTDAEKATFNQSVIPDLISIQSGGAISGKADQRIAPYPLEVLTTFGVPAAGTYCLAVNNVSDTKEARPAGPTWMQMQLYQAPEGGNTVEYTTPEEPSVNPPADSANEALIAVAGADPVSNTLTSNSGRGPTRDGRIKPDIVASYIEVDGGHIDAAAVAGAIAALVKDRYEDYTPAQIADYLKMNAIDRGDAGQDNSWGHGFVVLPDDTDPKAAAKAYVEEAIRAYRENPEAAKAHYQSEASVDRQTDLYLILIDGTEIIVNGGFSGAVGADITSRIGTDAIGKEYGKELVAADANGRFVDYLIPDPLHDYTLYRKHTWAIKADDGLVFAAGSWDKTEDVEATLEPHQDVIAAIYKAGARLLTLGAPPTFQYYNTPDSIDGERYVFLALQDGTIVADATRSDLLRTNIADLQASDDSALGQKIAALQEGEELWISHMWRNPTTGQEEQKHTYVTRFLGIIFGSGYYGDTPPPDACIEAIDVPTTIDEVWNDTCLSGNRPQDSAEGGEAGREYYARFYTFTLDNPAKATITLTSDSVDDTFLYLMKDAGSDGAIETSNDDIDRPADKHSRIDGYLLGAGTYTIEATTYSPDTTGYFTLEVEIEPTDVPTVPPVGVKYTAISSGANHVCAIAADGSIMCWGDDSEGQVSERPTSGRFTEISSGETHTCALRDDGAVVCWGSIDIP